MAENVSKIQIRYRNELHLLYLAILYLRYSPTLTTRVTVYKSHVFLQFYRKGSTGETSSLPFVAGALNCAVWAKYGAAVAQPGTDAGQTRRIYQTSWGHPYMTSTLRGEGGLAGKKM